MPCNFFSNLECQCSQTLFNTIISTPKLSVKQSRKRLQVRCGSYTKIKYGQPNHKTKYSAGQQLSISDKNLRGHGQPLWLFPLMVTSTGAWSTIDVVQSVGHIQFALSWGSYNPVLPGKGKAPLSSYFHLCVI